MSERIRTKTTKPKLEKINQTSEKDPLSSIVNQIQYKLEHLKLFLVEEDIDNADIKDHTLVCLILKRAKIKNPHTYSQLTLAASTRFNQNMLEDVRKFAGVISTQLKPNTLLKTTERTALLAAFYKFLSSLIDQQT